MVGYIVKDVRGERMNLDLKKIVDKEMKSTEQNVEEEIKEVLVEGRRIYAAYEKHCL